MVRESIRESRQMVSLMNRLRRKSVFLELSDFFGLFPLGKVQNYPASFSSSELSAHQMAPRGVIAHSSSSELSAHQMAPSGVIPHWRSPCALEPPSLALHVLFGCGKETSCRRSSVRRVMHSLAGNTRHFDSEFDLACPESSVSTVLVKKGVAGSATL